MKRLVAILSFFVLCLSLYACSSTSVETEQEITETFEAAKTISNEIVYDWLLENGKLIDGTTISYAINGKNGGILNVSAGQDKMVVLSYVSMSSEGLEVECTMPLFSENSLLIDSMIVDHTITGREYSYKLDKASFTTNSPIEKGDFKWLYIDGEYHNSLLKRDGKYFVKHYLGEEEIPYEKIVVADAIDDVFDQLTHQNICDMLDLMGTGLCELWDIKLADLGFEMYLPTSAPSVIA